MEKLDQCLRKSRFIGDFNTSKLLNLTINEARIYKTLIIMTGNSIIPIETRIIHVTNVINKNITKNNDKYNKNNEILSYYKVKRIINELYKKGLIDKWTVTYGLSPGKFRKAMYIRIAL